MMDLPPCTPSTMIMEETFEDEESPVAHTITAHKNYDIVRLPGEDSNVLQSTYVGYEQGSRRNYASLALPKPYEEITLAFDVKFDADFQFVRGGKLPGMAPKGRLTLEKLDLPDMWSALTMWGPEGVPVTYTYHQNRSRKWGDFGERFGDYKFPRGEWVTVSMHMRLNSKAGEPGITEVYVDGQRMAAHEGLIFRTLFSEESAIHQIRFNTFHGGNTPDYAPRNADGGFATLYAWFDNLQVHEGTCARPAPERRFSNIP